MLKKSIYLTILTMVIVTLLSLNFISILISSSSRGIVRSMVENTKINAMVSGKVVYCALQKNN